MAVMQLAAQYQSTASGNALQTGLVNLMALQFHHPRDTRFFNTFGTLSKNPPQSP